MLRIKYELGSEKIETSKATTYHRSSSTYHLAVRPLLHRRLSSSLLTFQFVEFRGGSTYLFRSIIRGVHRKRKMGLPLDLYVL